MCNPKEEGVIVACFVLPSQVQFALDLTLLICAIIKTFLRNTFLIAWKRNTFLLFPSHKRIILFLMLSQKNYFIAIADNQK